MSFVRLNKIWHTTGFRVAITFLLIFIFSILLLFGYIYWKTTHYLIKEVDESLEARITQIKTIPQDHLESLVQKSVKNDASLLEPLSLFTTQGQYIAGDLRALPEVVQFNKPYNFYIRRVSNSKRLILRGILYKVPESNNIIIISSNIRGLHEFNELLLGAMLSSLAIVLLLGSMGAILIGQSAQRQLDKTTIAIKKIIQGDLKERLPVNNKRNDINRLAKILNQMLDEIERLMQHLKTACDDIAHDLRTPLTRLIAGLERMQRKERTKEEYEQAINLAVEEAQTLLHTFKALLKISEVENSLQRHNFSSVDLNMIINDVVEFYEPVAEEKEIKLITQKKDNPLIIQGDQYLLFDALSNLLDNALKFTPNKGNITVKLNNTSGKMTLKICDTGIGIPESERKDVLRRFYRSEHSRHTPGNGLGLSMVAAVAHMHNMILTIEDASPGCCISLTLSQ